MIICKPQCDPAGRKYTMMESVEIGLKRCFDKGFYAGVAVSLVVYGYLHLVYWLSR